MLHSSPLFPVTYMLYAQHLVPESILRLRQQLAPSHENTYVLYCTK